MVHSASCTSTQLHPSILGTRSRIPILTCPDNITPLPPPDLTAEQEVKLSSFREYVGSILLPKEDDRYQTEEQWVSDACLKRYLRAAKWNLQDAKNRIKYSLEWRREYKPTEIDPKTVEAEVLKKSVITI